MPSWRRGLRVNGMHTIQPAEAVDTLVIGGGQAGLAVGYHLQRQRVPFLIVDANPRIGDAWRNRWDSLRLFSPAAFDGLAGMPFPAADFAFPTKDEMADYLQAYAARFDLPVRTGVRIDRLWHADGRFQAQAGERLSGGQRRCRHGGLSAAAHPRLLCATVASDRPVAREPVPQPIAARGGWRSGGGRG
jgi:hypothetical protein